MNKFRYDYDEITVETFKWNVMARKRHDDMTNWLIGYIL